MINEVYFYWIGWMLWILTTFFMSYGRERDLYTIWLMSLMILSNTNIHIGLTQINASTFPIMLGSIILLLNLQRQIYLTVCTVTIILGYTSILFWEIVAPVWLFLPRELLIPLLLGLTALILVNELKSRICVILLGATMGEYVFSFYLFSYGMTRGVGELPFLGNIMMTIVIIVFLDIIRKSRVKKVKNHDLPIDLEVAK
ncbi:YphA family membrane protein [Oceanobacillus manasiensis]|uniref:YphA family membrane protein n=1 Tax=Oceanobacillus manasiensis TaxID=586413 RepID=UPI0005AA56A4|nr:hypothetical protein [Oceanobacillus manasiensis]